MRIIFALFVFSFSSFIISSCKEKDSGSAKSIPKDEIASVVYMIIGEVKLEDDKGASYPVEPKVTKLYSFHTLSTNDNSRADILLYDGTIIRLYQNTKVSISNLLDTNQSESNSELKMAKGRMFVKTNKLPKNRNIKVSTSSSVAGVRGTEFLVYDEDDRSSILVGEGRVEGSNTSGTSGYIIEPGQKMEVDDEEATLSDMTEEEKEDFQKESNSVASIVESGRNEIQGILNQFQEEKKKILETIEIQKEQNRELINEQKEKNKALIQDAKDKTKKAKQEVEDNTKSEMDKIKSGSQSEMDRIRSGNQ